MDNKIVVLIEEAPERGTFSTVAGLLGLRGIDPLNFIEPESHMLANIYNETCTDRTANEVMGYLIHRKGSPLVFDVLNAIHNEDERLVLVNTTLLSDEDIKFLSMTLEHVLTYRLLGDPQEESTKIYNGSKKYRETMYSTPSAEDPLVLSMGPKPRQRP